MSRRNSRASRCAPARLPSTKSCCFPIASGSRPNPRPCGREFGAAYGHRRSRRQGGLRRPCREAITPTACVKGLTGGGGVARRLADRVTLGRREVTGVGGNSFPAKKIDRVSASMSSSSSEAAGAETGLLPAIADSAPNEDDVREFVATVLAKLTLAVGKSAPA